MGLYILGVACAVAAQVSGMFLWAHWHETRRGSRKLQLPDRLASVPESALLTLCFAVLASLSFSEALGQPIP
jgi:hypothetical protein